MCVFEKIDKYVLGFEIELVKTTQEFSNEWNVEATPTVVFLKDGRQMDKLVGAETSELQKKTAAAADLFLRKP